MAGIMQRWTLLGSSFYFLLLVIGSVLTTSGFYDNVPHVCKNRTGETVRLPSKRCDAYIECFAGMAFLRLCAPGTSFNSRSAQCDLPRGTDCTYQGGHQFHGSEVQQFRHLFTGTEGQSLPKDTKDATLEDDTKSDDTHKERIPLHSAVPKETNENNVRTAKTNEFYLNPTIVVTGPAKLGVKTGPVRRRYIRSVEAATQRIHATQALKVAATNPKLHGLGQGSVVPSVKKKVEGKSLNPQVQNTEAQEPIQSMPEGRQGMSQAQLQQIYEKQMMQQQQQQMPNQQQFPHQMPNHQQMQQIQQQPMPGQQQLPQPISNYQQMQQVPPQQFQQQQIPNQQQVPQPMPNQQFQSQQQMQQGGLQHQFMQNQQQPPPPQFQGAKQQQLPGTGFPLSQQNMQPYFNPIHQVANSGGSNNVNTNIRPMLGTRSPTVQGRNYQQPRQNSIRNYQRPRNHRNRLLFPSFKSSIRRMMRPHYHPPRRMTSSSYHQRAPTRSSSYSSSIDLDSFSPSGRSYSISDDEKMMNNMFEKLKTTTMDESLDMAKDNGFLKSFDIPQSTDFYYGKARRPPEKKSIDLSDSLPDYTFPYEKKYAKKGSQDSDEFIRANDGFSHDFELKDFPEYGNYSTSPSDPYAGVSDFYDRKNPDKSNEYELPRKYEKYNDYQSPMLRGAKAFTEEYDDNYSKYAQSNNQMYGPAEYTHDFGHSDDGQSTGQGERNKKQNSAPVQTPIWIHPFANGGSVFSDVDSKSQGSRQSGDYGKGIPHDRDSYESEYPSRYEGGKDEDYYRDSYPSNSKNYDAKQGGVSHGYGRDKNYNAKNLGSAYRSQSPYSHRDSGKRRSRYSKHSRDDGSYSSDYHTDKQRRGYHGSDNSKSYASHRVHDSHRDYDKKSQSNREYDQKRNYDSDRDYEYNRDYDSNRQYESKDDNSRDTRKEKDDPYTNEKNREKSYKPTDPDSYYNADNPGPFSTDDPGYPYTPEYSSNSKPEGSEGGGPENQDEGGSHTKYGRKPPTFDSFPFNFMPKHLTGPMFTDSGSMDFKENAGFGHVGKLDLDENGDVQYDDVDHRVAPVKEEGDKDKFMKATTEIKHQGQEKVGPTKVHDKSEQVEGQTEPGQPPEDKAKSRKKRHTWGYSQPHSNPRLSSYLPGTRYGGGKFPPSLGSKNYSPSTNYGTHHFAPRMGSKNYSPSTNYGTHNFAPRMGSKKYSPSANYGTHHFASRMGAKNYSPRTNYGTHHFAPRMGSKNYSPSTNYGTHQFAPRTTFGTRNLVPSTQYNTNQWAPRSNINTRQFATHTNYGMKNLSPRMNSKSYSPNLNYGTHNFAPKNTFSTRNIAPRTNYNTNQWAPRGNMNTRQFAPKVPQQAPRPPKPKAPNMDHIARSLSTNYNIQLPLFFDGGVADPTRGVPTAVLRDIKGKNTIQASKAKLTAKKEKEDKNTRKSVDHQTGTTGASGNGASGDSTAMPLADKTGGTGATGASGQTGAPGIHGNSRKKRHTGGYLQTYHDPTRGVITTTLRKNTDEEEKKYDVPKLTHYTKLDITSSNGLNVEETEQPLNDMGYGSQWPMQDQSIKGYGDTFYSPSGGSGVPYNTFGSQGNYALGGKAGSSNYDFKGDMPSENYYTSKPNSLDYPSPLQPYELEKIDMNFQTLTPSPKTQKQIFLETIHLSPQESEFLNPQQRSGDGFFEKDSNSDYDYGQDKWSNDKWSESKWSDDAKWTNDKWPRETWADHFSDDKWGDDKWSGNSKWSDLDKYPDLKSWTPEDDAKWSRLNNSPDWNPFSGGSNPRFDLKKGSANPVEADREDIGEKTVSSSK